MATGANDIQGAFEGIGGVVKGYFDWQASQSLSAGYGASASLFGKAAKLSRQNEDISKEATSIKLMQADRLIYKTISGQQSDVASSGFAASGSALDLLRDSTAQGELTMSLVTKQGEIDANAYEQQAIAYKAQQTMALAQQGAADASGMGSLIGGALKGLSAAVPFFL